MKLIYTITLMVLFACSEPKTLTTSELVASMQLDSTNTYGAMPAQLGVEPRLLTAAIEAKAFGEPVRIKSRVTNSCSSKGCWMIINDDQQTVRVTFKDYGFFVPLGFQDRDVVIEGILSEEDIPEDVLRHYAEDDGKSEEEVAAIVGSEKQYTFVATSVVALPL